MKMFIKALTIFLLIVFLIKSIDSNDSGDDEWNYDDQDNWNSHFKSCEGKYESPINIDTTKVKLNPNLKLEFHHYNEKFYKVTVQNNGHTVRVFLQPNPKNQDPYITGEAVNNENYILDSFHFHWGLNEFNGSEHSIDGTERSAELHLVHWNDKFGNLSNAMNKETGLVVVVIFIETKVMAGSKVIHISVHNRALTPIIDVLPNIVEFGRNYRLKVPINLNALIPKDKDIFFKYPGSLTTPPCSETATFIVFMTPIYMTVNQLKKFRQIKGHPIGGKSKALTHNIRAQMPLNDRLVEASNPYTKSNTVIV